MAYLLAVPLQITVEEGPDEPGGLPKRLGSSPRVPVRASLAVGDCVATIQQAPRITDSLVPQTSAAELILRTPANSLDGGVATTRDLAATLIDLLSFQMQAPVHILQLEAIDISSPLVNGEDCQLSMQPQAGNGFANLFFTGDMDFQWVIDARMEAQLMEPLPLDSKPRLALWWYLKVLYTPFIIDQFLFLWTALEVLSPLNASHASAAPALRAGLPPNKWSWAVPSRRGTLAWCDRSNDRTPGDSQPSRRPRSSSGSWPASGHLSHSASPDLRSQPPSP